MKKKREILWTPETYNLLKNYQDTTIENLTRLTGVTQPTIRKIKRYYNLSKRDIAVLKKYLAKVPYLNIGEIKLLEMLANGRKTTYELTEDIRSLLLIRQYLKKFEQLGLIESKLVQAVWTITEKGRNALKKEKLKPIEREILKALSKGEKTITELKQSTSRLKSKSRETIYAYLKKLKTQGYTKANIIHRWERTPTKRGLEVLKTYNKIIKILKSRKS